MRSIRCPVDWLRAEVHRVWACDLTSRDRVPPLPESGSGDWRRLAGHLSHPRCAVACTLTVCMRKPKPRTRQYASPLLAYFTASTGAAQVAKRG